MALLGMFIVHFHVRSTEPGGFDDWVRTGVWRLVETKSHGTFALLFGAGCAMVLTRWSARGGPIAGRYLRRLGVLAVVGVAAHACFGFNVLLGYAVWGVPLLLLRQASTRLLLLIALLSAASVPTYRAVSTHILRVNAGSEAVVAAEAAANAHAADVREVLRAAEAQESYRVLLAARLRHMGWFHTQPFFVLPSVTLALFIAGLLLIRHRVFEDPRAHMPLLCSLIAFGVVSWLADNWVLPRWGVPTFGLVRDQWLTFAYVGGALILLARQPALLGRLGPISNAGRMAFTNYLLQIAALDLLFSGYAIGLGTIRPIVGVAAAVACFALEAWLSTIWLKHFRYGPAEWLWRAAAYGRLEPNRRRVIPPDAVRA